MSHTAEGERLIREWITSLRSGDYKQAKGTLCLLNEQNEVQGYCCLGVFATLFPKRFNPEGVELGRSPKIVNPRPSHGKAIVVHGGPNDVYDNIRQFFLDTFGADHVVDYAIDDNDAGKDFNYIADQLEYLLEHGTYGEEEEE